MLKEFKEFAMRGNVVDMAVGIIIGGAFGTIVKSMVDNMLMPPVGLLLGGVDFSNLFAVLKSGSTPGPYATPAEAQAAGAVTINYGLFFNSVISFLIVAFALFLLIKGMNRLQREKEAPPAEPTTKECRYCKSEIPLEATRCPNMMGKMMARPATCAQHHSACAFKFEDEFAALLIYQDPSAVLQSAKQYLFGYRSLDLRLNEAGHRSRSEQIVITVLGQPCAG